MKIEPRKTAALPKYAVLLASAVLLTGCGTDDPAALAGETQIIDPTLDLAGDEAFFPDLTETPAQTTAEPILLEGEALPYDGDDYCTTETTAVSKPQIAGLIEVNPDTVQRDDPVMLDGDVAFAPDFQTDTNADKLELSAEAYQSALAAHGISVTKSGRIVNWFGAEFYEGLKNDADRVQVIFFDGKASDPGNPGVTQREWLQNYFTEQYDWGGVLRTENPDAEACVVFVDINAETVPETVAEDAGL